MQSVVFAGLVCLLVHYVTAVTELTDATFYSYSQDKEVLLVDFFAPWCSDCKNLDPDFEAAARSLGVRSVDLVKVDCFGAGKGLCATYGVKRWPTLKNFNRGQYTGDYNGGLTAADIAGYITTVENSVIQQGVSPYAAAQPQPSPPLDVTCDTKCKIAKALNNQYLAMKTKKEAFLHSAPAEPTFAAAPVQASVALQPSKEVLNAMECAKCRIMKPADKLSKRSTVNEKKGTPTAKEKSGYSGLSRKAERELLSNFLNKAFTALYKRKEYIDVLTPQQARRVAYEAADKKASVGDNRTPGREALGESYVKTLTNGDGTRIPNRNPRNLVTFTRDLSKHVTKIFQQNMLDVLYDY